MYVYLVSIQSEHVFLGAIRNAANDPVRELLGISQT